MPNSTDFYKGIFLHVIPFRITVPWTSKQRWLSLALYKPPFLNRANSVLDHYLLTYANIILIVDFNFCVENINFEANLENNNLSTLTNISLPVTTLITPLVLVSFWPTKGTSFSYLAHLKQISQITIRWTDLNWTDPHIKTI